MRLLPLSCLLIQLLIPVPVKAQDIYERSCWLEKFLGYYYNGTKSTTSTNRTCQRWDSQEPHEHGQTDPKQYPMDESIMAAENYCRNPDSSTPDGPWCYTTDPDSRWEFCGVPLCNANSSEPNIGVCDISGLKCVATDCCPHMYGGEDLCADSSGQYCCLHTADCKWKQRQQDMSFWLQGSYALPRSAFGCPISTRRPWIVTKIGLQMKSSMANSTHAKVSWVQGPVGGQLATITTCLQIESMLPRNIREGQPAWPKGSYCLYKTKDKCPHGFSEGWVVVDGVSGSVSRDTGLEPVRLADNGSVSVHFCCRHDEASSTPIPLPTPDPFMLIQDDAECQEVLYMLPSPDFIQIDFGPNSVPISFGHVPYNMTWDPSTVTINMCHYKPYEGCQYASDNGRSYHGFHNLTVLGPCTNWQTETGWWGYAGNPELVGSIRENYCTGARTLNPKAFCTSHFSGNTACSIPFCEDFRKAAGVSRRSTSFPVRQLSGNIVKAANVIDGQIGTCSLQESIFRPWWQINLQRTETVIGLEIQDTLGSRCAWSNMEIAVTTGPDDFYDQQGLVCIKDFWGYGTTLQINCAQPVEGQYLTIRQGTRPPLWNPATDINRCLSLCELDVYTKESECGATLEQADVDPRFQVEASSSEDEFTSEHTALYSQKGWCAAPTDTNPYLMVDLLMTRRITGLLTQGNPDSRLPAGVKQFTISYGYTKQEMRHLGENKRIKVFSVRDGGSQKPFHHDLLPWIQARFVKLTFTEWNARPCFRFKLIGCQHRQVNLVSGNEWMPNEGGEVLQDNRRETCLPVDKLRWGVTLTSQLHVTDVTLRLSNSFSVNVEIWVTSNEGASESELDQWKLCGRQEAETMILGMRCDLEPIGSRVLFVMDNVTNMEVCEVEIYGGTSATFSYSSSSSMTSRTLDVTCPEGHTIQMFAVKKSLDWYDLGQVHRALYVTLTETVLSALGSWCSGNTRDCSVLPDYLPGTNVYVMFGCVSVPIQDTVCEYSVSDEGPLLLTGNYLQMYGSSKVCSWVITAPSGKFVKLEITGFKIPTAENSFMDGPYLINVGTCADILEVGYITTTGQEPEMMKVTGKQSYISPGSVLVVRLTTCYRYFFLAPEVQLETEVQFSTCFGCAVLSDCSGKELCNMPCGMLQSPLYPLDYASNRKCSWRVTVASDAYIRFEFVDFDVFEEGSTQCNRDVVELFDFDYTGTKQKRIGRYCNTFKPPGQVETGWNVLRVDFYTDGENSRKGFKASYKAIYYELTDNGTNTENSTACNEGWAYFNDNCFRIFNDSRLITWLQAEAECYVNGSNLGSIHNQAEMTFLNFLLISKYKITEVYIGLTDREQEGVFRWVDGSPLTYTSWRLNEPNGGAIEDCGVISLAGVRAQPSWGDIPCAAATISNFLCSHKASGRPKQEAVQIVLGPSPGSVSCAGEDLFRCSTDDCVQAVFRCDGKADCVNGTDEEDCGSECGSTLFTCDDGQCVSLAFVCDGNPHCRDKSDEALCDYPVCEDNDFRCGSGECVPSEARCDLRIDCADKSDEIDCNSCSASRTFQCYEGTCLPRGRVCDNTLDCPGLLREDESADACQGSFSQTCIDWHRKGYTKNGRYSLQTPGNAPISVTCDMTGTPGHVVTIIHHNHESPNVTFHGFEAPGSYKRNMTYFADWASILIIRGLADRCEQFLEVYCRNAEVFAKSMFVGADGKLHRYDDDVTGNGCHCRLDRVCRIRPEDTTCYCASPDKDIDYIDRGYFTEIAVLPILQLTMEDTGGITELARYTIGPLRCYHKIKDGVGLMLCKSGQSFVAGDLCLYTEDEFGVPLSCRDATHLENCESFKCPVNYFKCPVSFCVAAVNVCDGKRNCENGEDEMQCASYSCPGMLRCQGQQNCVPLNQICDGTRHCPQGDDEWFCDVMCPTSCNCTGLVYECLQAGLTTVPDDVSPRARKLDVSDNAINISLATQRLSRMTFLVELLMARNGITSIPAMFFSDLVNLQRLDISENTISVLVANTFVGLRNLKLLNLKGNPLTYIAPNAFTDLLSLPALDISKLMLTNISKDTFAGMYKLKVLDMSQNAITKLEEGIFADLKEIVNIKMYGNDLKEFMKGDFAALSSLRTMHSDDFMFCCFTGILDENCLPPKDLLSSCEDLMENNVLRTFLWILGGMAFCGNGFVFLYRSASKDRDRIPSMLIRNLSAADLLMGLYMLAIASVDLFYRGVYIENAQKWKTSIICQILGCLSTIASEASVFTLGFITVDRLINILFPLSIWKLTLKSTRYVLIGLWLSVIVIAAIPLIPGSYFQGVFYSRSGVCVSLYITAEQTPGWEYSFFIFHGLNLCVFVFIFFAYGYMYQIIKRAGAVGAGEQRKREMAAARKMTLIVVTDFCCWVPINIMGFLALFGTQIPGSVYAWTVVFIMPVNSALNPVLYTISSITFPWQKAAKEAEMSSTLQTERTKVLVGLNDKGDIGNTLEIWMKSGQAGNLSAVVKVTQHIALLLQSLHEDGLYLGQLDPQTVYIDMTKDRAVVSFSGYPQMHVLNPEGQATDIEAFGKLLSRLLRALVIAKR